MLKELAKSIVLLTLMGAGLAFAGQGFPPNQAGGFAMQDGTWLNGLAGGVNYTYQSGISAAGTTQATATALPSGIYLMEVDTAAASSGVALPPCLQGTQMFLYNNGANTLTVYPAVANNPVTAAQDTINNGTTLSGGVASHVAEVLFCAKNGVWAAK